ncbi:MAG: hypothetical protein R3226_10520, partial [Halomonas venusta]|nr:hypothetical protein [Halomonas venusta]
MFIFGTSNVSGRAIKVSQGVCGGHIESSVTADTDNGDGTFTWVASVTLVNGYNWIEVSDGNSWDYLGINTTGGTTANAPITLDIPTGVTETWSGCASS